MATLFDQTIVGGAVIFSANEAVASGTTYTITLPEPGGYDTNSIIGDQTFPSGSNMRLVSGFTHFTFKAPRASWEDVAAAGLLQNNINDYLEAAEGYEGTDTATFEIQAPSLETAQFTISASIDIDSPAVTVNSITTSDTTPTVTGTYDDPTATISVVLNGVTYTPDLAHPNWSFTAETLTAGAYTASATVTDGAGNVTVIEGTVTVDTSGPSLSVDTSQTNDTTPLITGYVSDSSATVSVTVNGVQYAATVVGTTWSAQVTNELALGTYVASATATDSFGNTSTADSSLVIYAITTSTRRQKTAFLTYLYRRRARR